MKTLLAALLVATGAVSASADPLITVFAQDSVYQATPLEQSIDSSASGSAAQFDFHLAVYSRAFTIYLTDSLNMVTNSIVSFASADGTDPDHLVVSGSASGAAGIGSACASSASVACVVSTGQMIDLTNLVSDFNGGNGICCTNIGPVYLRVQTFAGDVPEPAMLGLFGLGAIGLGLSRRRKT